MRIWPLVMLLLPCQALAVDGIVVNTRNGTGSLQYYGTIDGELWRHDIINDTVSASYKIYAGPASRPAISPDGVRVAFIRKTGDATGKVVMIDINGTGLVELADCLRNSLIDFPHPDFVYFTMGGFHESTSGLLKRVNIHTLTIETVMQVKGRSGANTRIAQLQISNDLSRAVVRTGDSESDPYGEIVALDLSSDDRLDQTIGTRYSCGGGLFADGVHAIDGWGAHDGFDIRRYTDAYLVKAFSNTDAFAWPPNNGAGDPVDLNHGIFNTGGATNSDRWLCLTTGGERNYKWHSMMLFNWQEQRCVFVTRGLAGPWDQGDFWVGEVAQPDTTPPTLAVATTTTGIDDLVVVTFSEQVAPATAEVAYHYAINQGVTVNAADLQADGRRVNLTTSKLPEGSLVLTVNSVTDLAGNAMASNSQVGFTHEYGEEPTTNQAPVVDAGADQIIYVGATATLLGSVNDDGLPHGAVQADWSVLVGDAAAVVFGEAGNPITTVRFLVAGTFTLQLYASDGALVAVDELVMTVTPAQTITLLSPTGGEVWPVGSVHTIEWTTTSVDDVMILASFDDGKTWDTIVPSIDTSAPGWGAYAWTVPDAPTAAARIMVDAYIRGNAKPPVSAPFAIVAPAAAEPSVTPQVLGDIEVTGTNCSAAASGLGAPLALLLLGWATNRRRSRALGAVAIALDRVSQRRSGVCVRGWSTIPPNCHKQ